MKKIILSLIFASIALAVYAGTVTNHGIVSTTRLITDTASDTADLTQLSDFSSYATYGCEGMVVRQYKFGSKPYGTNTATAYPMYPGGNTELKIPANAIICGGRAEVITRVLPTNCIITIGTSTSTNILNATTNMSTLGLHAILPAGSAGTDVKVGDTAEALNLTFTTSAPTQGMFIVYLNYIQGW